mgnify:FL=1
MEPHAVERRQHPPLWPGALAVALVILAVAGVILVIAARNQMPLATLTRDPVEIAGLRWQTGLLYKLSLLVWGATVAVCLFGAAVWRRSGQDPRLGAFLLASGVLTLVFAVDDAFQIRSEIDDHLRIPEVGVFVMYAVALVVFALAFGRTVVRTGYGVLVVAVAVSVAWLGLRQMGVALALQDGVRFVAQLLLLLYFCRTGVYGLRHHREGG